MTMEVRQAMYLKVLCLLAQMFQTSLSQQCTNEGSIFGWKLQRHIYKTMVANLGHECLLICRRDDRCQSFNWVLSLSMCEFSNRTKEARPEDFVPDPDRYYFTRDIKRVPLGSIPELPAETCKEIKASEGQAVSKKYWLSTIKLGIPVLAHCDMETGDINECSVTPSVCHVNANCQNNVGSYHCSCKPGFRGDGKTCKDIDECTVSPSVCHVNANCQNNVGSYHCSCKPGFSGGKTCQDINECTVSPSVCHVNANCQNSVGSYQCSCKPGFSGDGKTCQDINECTVSPFVCHVNANCQNNVGSYHCSCKPGFSGDGKTCQASSCQGIKRANSNAGDGSYMISPASTSVQVYCDMPTSGQGWTLVARFSNNDAKNWMKDSGEWWYNRNVAVGGTTDPSKNTDMISPAFWLVSGNEFKITSSNDPQHTALLQTTGDCLGGRTFRSKITSYGDYRNGAVWSSDQCLGKCTVQHGGHYQTTSGFKQATCNGNIQSANAVGFWCDWDGGDGAVLMIGGGGTNCERADHGIGITEANEASFNDGGTKEHDFGDEANSQQSSSYSLNLWVR